MGTKIPSLPSVVPDPVHGLYHLPRLWEKYTLETRGLIHPDYALGSGFDAMLRDHFGVKHEDLEVFVRDTNPSLYQFCVKFGELAQAAGKPIADGTAEWNKGAADYEHADETLAGIFKAEGYGGAVPFKQAWKANLCEDADALLAALNQPA